MSPSSGPQPHAHATGPRFLEIQPLHRNPIIRVLVPVSMLTTTGILGAVALAGQGSGQSLFLVWLACIALEAGLVFGFRQRVRVGDGRLDAVVTPLYPWKRSIPVDRIESLVRVKVDPMSELGGWGLKWSKKHGLAMIITGDQAVALTHDGGRKLLLGSPRADELAAAIRAEREAVAPGLAPLGEPTTN